jgi:hypothetical protein
MVFVVLTGLFLNKALLKPNVDFDPMVIGADTRHSCRKAGKGRPRRLKSTRRLPNRPLKSERL